jgi:hypothetical protein
MSWLYSLVEGLTEMEVESLKNLRLIGKEAELLECYFVCSKNHEEPEITFLKNKLKISDTHVYKIQSVLLDKLLLHFVPSGKIQLLEWLRQKELYPLLKYEIKSQLKKKNSAEYYLETFRLLIDLPYKFYDDKLVADVGKHYLKALHPCNEADKKYIQFHLLFANCNRFAASKNPALFFGYAENDLLQMESDLLQNKYYLALYYLYRTLCNYYKYYKKKLACRFITFKKRAYSKNTYALTLLLILNCFCAFCMQMLYWAFPKLKTHLLYTPNRLKKVFRNRCMAIIIIVNNMPLPQF